MESIIHLRVTVLPLYLYAGDAICYVSYCWC